MPCIQREHLPLHALSSFIYKMKFNDDQHELSSSSRMQHRPVVYDSQLYAVNLIRCVYNTSVKARYTG